ncbi:MAG: hemerythrin domain-containing protein [Deltaproteobacteria bacterium]|nr:hemerythrin domain-containing protein [Deltaproteobacteria bacterium]
MSVKTNASVETVHEAAEELKEEHRALATMVQKLKETSEASAIDEVVELLQALFPKLEAHFAKEERPGGLYDRMGATAHPKSDALQALVDDHYRILSSIRSAKIGTEPSQKGETIAYAHKLAEWLKDHEQREHALATT